MDSPIIKKTILKGHLPFKQQKTFFRGHCPGSGAFLIPGSEIRDGKKSGSGVRDNLPGSPTL